MPGNIIVTSTTFNMYLAAKIREYIVLYHPPTYVLKIKYFFFKSTGIHDINWKLQRFVNNPILSGISKPYWTPIFIGKICMYVYVSIYNNALILCRYEHRSPLSEIWKILKSKNIHHHTICYPSRALLKFGIELNLSKILLCILEWVSFVLMDHQRHWACLTIDRWIESVMCAERVTCLWRVDSV